MCHGGVVRSDSIVEVHLNVIGATRDESYYEYEPGGSAGSAGSALRHAQPFVESIG